MHKYPSPTDEPRVRMVEVRLVEEPKAFYQVLGPRDVARLLRELIGDADRENFVAVYLDTRHRVSHVQTVSVGHLSASLVHPREVFKGALLANAQALVVGHNHPSGDVTPSIEDRKVFDRLAEVGRLMGIELLDSVVVGPSKQFWSTVQNGVQEF